MPFFHYYSDYFFFRFDNSQILCYNLIKVELKQKSGAGVPPPTPPLPKKG
jgi:hypothetical protein